MSVLTRQRRIGGIGDLKVGDHVCWSYGDDRQFGEAVATFVADGLAAGQRVACYVADESVAALRSRLESAVAGFESAERAGAVVLGGTREAYRSGGAFEPDEALRGFGALADAALADGYSALRVVGETTELIRDADSREVWTAYELRADLMIARKQLIGVCAYDARRSDEDALTFLRALHASSLGPWHHESPFHLNGSLTGALLVGGDIDFLVSIEIGRVAPHAAPDLSEPVLDLSGLRFIDVAGMRALAGGARAIAGVHPEVRIRGAGPTFKRLWQLLAYDRSIPVEFETS